MKFKLKRIDWYIIKQFLGTYIFAIILIISISVVFDINEKIDKFLKPEVPINAIVFDYYLNFIPYFANLFSPLFTFIAVIFFTSKLADRSEVIAMLASGISFKRLMVPYAISATIIAFSTFILNAFIIPPANKTRIDFQNKYIKNKAVEYARNVQLEVEPGVVAYFDRYDARSNMGYRFSLEHFDGKRLISRLTANSIKYDTLYHWQVIDYAIRDFDGMREHISQGTRKDTTLTIVPSDFLISVNDCEEISRNGTEYRYWHWIKFLLYPLLYHHFNLCRKRICQPDDCSMDSQYSLHIHRNLFVSKGSEVGKYFLKYYHYWLNSVGYKHIIPFLRISCPL